MNAIPNNTRHDVEIAKLLAETAKLQAEIHEVNAKTTKLLAESKWYPVAIATGLIAAGAALTKLLAG